MSLYLDQQNQLLIQKARKYCYDQISFQDLKEFAVLNATTYLDSDHPTIAKLILEIAGSVAQVDEDLLTEEEFRVNLQVLLKDLEQEPEYRTGSLGPFDDNSYTFWEIEDLISRESANPNYPEPENTTTYARAVVA